MIARLVAWISERWARLFAGEPRDVPDAPGLPVYAAAGRHWVTRVGLWWYVMRDVPGDCVPMDRFALFASARRRMQELAEREADHAD